MTLMDTHAKLFETISELVMCHSPSGKESEVDALLEERFAALGLATGKDAANNLVVKMAGTGVGGRLAITAHKDEIGAIVTLIEDDGRIRVRKLGGSFPWVYGEGIVDLLGEGRVVSGVLSFGSRHVSHASPQFSQREEAPVRWADAWIETKLSASALEAAGVRPGSRMVVGKHRKAPFRLGNHIASYTLDNKASLAILLELAKRLKNPRPDVYLIATAQEEVGSLGALFFTQRLEIDAMIALEIAPIAAEYGVCDSDRPVLVVEDTFAAYDDSLNAVLRRSAAACDIPLQHAAFSNFGSDSSAAMKAGHLARGACLGFPTLNTHGYEIAHLGAIARCVDILEKVCAGDFSHPERR